MKQSTTYSKRYLCWSAGPAKIAKWACPKDRSRICFSNVECWMPNVDIISMSQSIKSKTQCPSRLDHFLLRPSSVLMTGIGQPKDTWSSCLLHCRSYRSSLGQTYMQLRNSIWHQTPLPYPSIPPPLSSPHTMSRRSSNAFNMDNTLTTQAYKVNISSCNKHNYPYPHRPVNS